MDLNFDPPETRGLDGSERADPDSGGMSFNFFDQGEDQPRKDQEQKKPRPPPDFGAPVELELSSMQEEPEATDGELPPGINLELSENAQPKSGPGQHINITV